MPYGERIDRLTALKDRLDPTNFFRMNANIPPREAAAAEMAHAMTNAR